ncbi:MAG: hypothetical protein U9Q85_04135 [Patescibacteria group bacterium]|nr:hypothetical protein [Patescibacteria group bacterium]
MLKNTLTILFFLIMAFFLPEDAKAATATGTIVSAIKDVGASTNWQTIAWSASTTASSTITIKARTATTSNMSSATAWDTCDNVTSDTDISANNCITDSNRYIQYQASLNAVYGTSSAWISPQLNSIVLNYARYAATGTLVSSFFDTGSAVNAWRKITWTESAPQGTKISFQLRTAPDIADSPGAWSSWFGPYDAEGYYKNPNGQNGISIIHNDGASDQWLQYRVLLQSNGANNPALSDLTLEYGDKRYSEIIIKDGTIFNDDAILR